MLLMRDRAAKHRIHVIQPRNLKIMEKNNITFFLTIYFICCFYKDKLYTV